MDVLPAIPNSDAEPNGIWATDTEGSRWHPSAPTDYAEWFLGVLHDEWLAGALRIAESRQMNVEQLPRNAFKTTLQQTVQALKRHRDISDYLPMRGTAAIWVCSPAVPGS